MNQRKRHLAQCVRASLGMGIVASSLLGSELAAQTVGPGTVTSAVNVTTGTTTIASGTTIDTRTPNTDATNVTGGTLTSDGIFSIYTNAGRGLYANGGSITATLGSNITTSRGAAMYTNGAASTITVDGAHVVILGIGNAAAAAGGIINITNSDFSDPSLATNPLGSGFAANAGGVINLQGGNRLYTGATTAVGLGASNAGSTINVSGSSLPAVMNGLGSLGVYLYNGGQLVNTTAAPISFTFNGTSAVGLTVDGTTMNAAVNGLSFNFTNTSSTGGTGINVLNGGVAKVDSITIGGPASALGAWVSAGGSLALTGNSTIDINSANNGQGWRLSNGTLINPIFGSVSVTSQRVGLYANGGTIDSTGTTINANAVRSYGAYAGAHGTVQSIITMTNNKVTSNGTGTVGLYAYANGLFNVTGSTVTTNGGATALYLWGYRNAANNQNTVFPSTINLTDSQVVATGVAYGLYSNNQTKGLDNVLNLTNSSLTSDSYALTVTGPATITAAQGSSITGSAGLLNAFAASSPTYMDPTLVNIVATGGSQLSGLARADADSEANITLQDQSSWLGESFYVHDVNVDGTSQWTIPASSVMSGLLTNNGLVQFTTPVDGAYKTLYTQSYVGSGVLGLNTFLGDDTSPSDRLIIDGGTATGSSHLRITNMDGPGALTSGNGIPLVEVLNGGQTAEGAFALASAVIAGPYEYTLYRGGVAEGTEQYWFLRSTVDCVNNPSHAACGSTPPNPPEPEPPPPPDPPGPGPAPAPSPAPAPGPDEPPTPPDPPPAPPPVPGPAEPDDELSPGVPNYRPEVSLYTALPAMALRYGWATLGNLHERVGEEEQLRGRSDLLQDNPFNALWVRVLAEDGDVDGAERGIYGDGPKYDYNIAAIQAGMDVYAEEHDNAQRDHTGFYLSTGRIRSDVTNYDGKDAGTNVVKGQSLGLYWTHYWDAGQYLDAVWQGTWNKSSARSNEGLELHHSGFGWAGSLEGGYPFHDESQVWEPQAQVIYQRVNSGSSQDAAAIIKFSDITSLVGRLGLRWADTWLQEPASDGSPRLFTGWLRFNVWKEFKGKPVTSFSSEDGYVPFEGSIKGTWWQLNAGMTWELDKNTSFYANLGYQQGFGSRNFSAWDGKLGFRWNW